MFVHFTCTVNSETRFSPQPSDAVNFFLPAAACSGCMTAGAVHAWGRLFETTRVRARVAQKIEDGENPSQLKASSSPQSRASRPPPIPASSHLLLLSPAPRLRQPLSRRCRRVLAPPADGAPEQPPSRLSSSCLASEGAGTRTSAAPCARGRRCEERQEASAAASCV